MSKIKFSSIYTKQISKKETNTNLTDENKNQILLNQILKNKVNLRARNKSDFVAISRKENTYTPKKLSLDHKISKKSIPKEKIILDVLPLQENLNEIFNVKTMKDFKEELCKEENEVRKLNFWEVANEAEESLDTNNSNISNMSKRSSETTTEMNYFNTDKKFQAKQKLHLKALNKKKFEGT